MASQAPIVTTEDCKAVADTLCGRVYEWTGVDWLAESSDWLVAKPLKIALIISTAYVGRVLLHRFIGRLVRRAAGTLASGAPGPQRRPLMSADASLSSERRRQRAETMGSVLRSVATGVIFAIAAVMVLSELGLNIAPLIASAGIIGVALGFGAQTLVKDFLSGLFIIFEDQFGVGDVVDLGEVSGTIEAVALRVTRLRDVRGTVWYVRNGEILRVGNRSQGWARIAVDVQVAFGTDIDRIRELLVRTAQELIADPDRPDFVLEDSQTWRIEQIPAGPVVVHMIVKTQPWHQEAVVEDLRSRVREACEREGIALPAAPTHSPPPHSRTQ